MPDNALVQPRGRICGMAIQWFPGHMHLTRQALQDRMKGIDVVIEMLDARLPGSSANPLLGAITAGRPALKVLNKQDLADPVRTGLWLAHYNGLKDTRALALQATMPAMARELLQHCRDLAPGRGGMAKPLRVLICGIPNVGKSTLINTLKGTRATRTADEPGVTRAEQRVELADDCYLFDTPGILWPRIIVAQSGYNLAASGAIGRNAFDDEDVAMALLDYLRTPYAGLLQARYRLDAVAAMQAEEILDAIGRRRSALRAGGAVDREKVAALVIHDFRIAAAGRISLETPDEFAHWLEHGLRLDAQRQLRKDALADKRGRRQRRPGRATMPSDDENDVSD
jgi:ribosome biogenesis GTPase A